MWLNQLLLHADLTGPYNGALLTFRIYFSDEYPFELPIIVFERDIFHPLVIGAEVDQDDDVFVEVTQKTASRTAETKPTGHFNLKSGLRNMAKDVSNYAEEGRISIIDILLHIRACFDDRRIIDEIHLQDIVNIAAWQAWQAHNEHLKDENNQELNEKDVWQQEMDSLIERSSNIKPEDMFEEVKHNNDSLSKQHGSDDAPGAD